MDTLGGANDYKQSLNCLMSFVSTTSEVSQLTGKSAEAENATQSGNGLKVLGMIYLKQ